MAACSFRRMVWRRLDLARRPAPGLRPAYWPSPVCGATAMKCREPWRFPEAARRVQSIRAPLHRAGEAP